MKKLKPFKILSEKTLYKDGSGMDLIEVELETPESKTINWSYIKTKNGVIILAIDEKNNVYLKKEWRLSRKDFVWEVPSGWIEIENPTKKEILEEANRELQEEVNVQSKDLKMIGSFYPSNRINGIFHVVLAQKLSTSSRKRDEHEFLDIQKLPFEKAYQKVTIDQIPNAQTLIAFQLAKQLLRYK